jgi:CHAD domain-containing protein
MPRTALTELLIRQRLNVLSRSLDRARKGDVTHVHQARVATRRLREALPVLAAGRHGRKLVRDMRRLTRALGPVRELDVALLSLDEFAKEGEVPVRATARLSQVIRQERRRVQSHLRDEIGRVDLEKLRKRAIAAARRGDVAGRARSADPKQLADARRRVARRAERLRTAIENAAGLYLPDRLHLVRIAVKKLRYAMELAREMSGSKATARIDTLKQIQDLLGRMNDLEVLIARVRGLQGSGKVPDLRLSSDLDVLVRRLETECRQLHGQYMASRRRVLAICEHAMSAAAGRRSAGRAA